MLSFYLLLRSLGVAAILSAQIFLTKHLLTMKMMMMMMQALVLVLMVVA
jgi:hypothetical protein